jgi:hypothetical protein
LTPLSNDSDNSGDEAVDELGNSREMICDDVFDLAFESINRQFVQPHPLVCGLTLVMCTTVASK